MEVRPYRPTAVPLDFDYDSVDEDVLRGAHTVTMMKFAFTCWGGTRLAAHLPDYPTSPRRPVTITEYENPYDTRSFSFDLPRDESPGINARGHGRRSAAVVAGNKVRKNLRDEIESSSEKRGDIRITSTSTVQKQQQARRQSSATANMAKMLPPSLAPRHPASTPPSDLTSKSQKRSTPRTLPTAKATASHAHRPAPPPLSLHRPAPPAPDDDFLSLATILENTVHRVLGNGANRGGLGAPQPQVPPLPPPPLRQQQEPRFEDHFNFFYALHLHLKNQQEQLQQALQHHQPVVAQGPQALEMAVNQAFQTGQPTEAIPIPPLERHEHLQRYLIQQHILPVSNATAAGTATPTHVPSVSPFLHQSRPGQPVNQSSLIGFIPRLYLPQQAQAMFGNVIPLLPPNGGGGGGGGGGATRMASLDASKHVYFQPSNRGHPCLTTSPKSSAVSTVFRHYKPIMSSDLLEMVINCLDCKKPFPPAGHGYFSFRILTMTDAIGRYLAEAQVVEQRLEWIKNELGSRPMYNSTQYGTADPDVGSSRHLHVVALRYLRHTLTHRLAQRKRSVHGGRDWQRNDGMCADEAEYANANAATAFPVNENRDENVGKEEEGHEQLGATVDPGLVLAVAFLGEEGVEGGGGE